MDEFSLIEFLDGLKWIAAVIAFIIIILVLIFLPDEAPKSSGYREPSAIEQLWYMLKWRLQHLFKRGKKK